MKGKNNYSKDTLLRVWIEFILAVLLIVIVLSGYTMISFNNMKKTTISQIDNNLFIGAKTIKHILPDDFHDRVTGPESITSKEDDQNINDLSSFAEQTGFKFLYTLIRRSDGIYITSSNATEEEIANNTEVRYYTKFTEADSLFLRSFKNNEQISFTHKDRWGIFRAYALPELSPEGKEYLSVAELDISRINKIITNKLLNLIIELSVLILASLPLIILLYKRMKQNFQEIQRNELLEKLVKERTKSLTESESKFRSYINNAPDGVFITDENGKYVDVNPAASRITGYSKEELLNLSIPELLQPEYIEKGIKSFLELTEKGSIRIDLGYHTKSGENRYWQVAGVKLSAKRFLGFAQDITDRKQAIEELQTANQQLTANEQQLRAAVHQLSASEEELQVANQQLIANEIELKDRENHLRSLVENPAGYVVYRHRFDRETGKHEIVQVSPSITDVMGIPEKYKYDFTRWFDNMLPEDLPEMEKAEKEGLKPPFQFFTEIRYRHPIAGIRWLDIRSNGIPFADDPSQKEYTNGIIIDITDRKIAEEKIQQDLEERTVLIKELYHRTKNNMQVIISLLSMEIRTYKDEKIKTLINEISNKIKSMALVHQKIYQSNHLCEISLKSYITDLTRYISSGMQQKETEIDFDHDLKEMNINIDTAIPLGLIVNEIITNSIKYAFPEKNHGTISIRLDLLPDKTIELMIKDNGVGLPVDFDVGKSGNLGWKIVTLLIKQIKGKVEFVNEKGCKIVIKFRDITKNRLEDVSDINA